MCLKISENTSVRLYFEQMKKFIICLFFVGFWGCKPVIHDGDSAVLRTSSGVGMFIVFDYIWSLAYCYEKKFCPFVKVDFGAEGPYYDPQKGPNWPSYYLEQVKWGKFEGGPVVETDEPKFAMGNFVPKRGNLDRRLVYSLLEKYMVLKPEILEEIERFSRKHFEGHFVVGIHYRGTDKVTEAPSTSYDEVLEKVREEMIPQKRSELKIFVATDEQAFVRYLNENFVGEVLEQSGVARSTTGQPIHLHQTSDQYENGKAAIVDCVLLSRTNLLIRTASNLSRWSTYFNPDLPVVVLSYEY